MTAPPAAVDGHREAGFAPVADTLAQQLARRPQAGAAVCIYHRGRCVVDIWGGLRNRAGEPWLRDTTVMAYSTGKGVASLLMHTLVDAGLAAYDDPVVEHWPEFAPGNVGAKADITIRHIMGHAAGLHRTGDWVDDLWALTDWGRMVDAVQRAQPVYAPGSRNGYQGFSYSWLIGELIQRVGGKPFGELLRERISEPLGLDGCCIGLPRSQLARRARLLRPHIPDASLALPLVRLAAPLVGGATLGRVRLDELRAALVLPSSRPFSFDDDRVVQACIPSSNGVFTARSLARVYALLSNGGTLDGVRLLSPSTVDEALTPQRRRRDLVTATHMDWRLGYHGAGGGPGTAPFRFGHFGYGGSGAFGDRRRNLAVAFVHTGHDGFNPLGGGQLTRIARAAIRCADDDG